MDEQSETFSVDDGCSSFLILLLWDPHGLESWEGTKDRSSDPDKEFSFCWCNYLDFHCWWCKSSNFLAETFRNSRIHCCSTAHDNVAIKIFSDVNIALEDWLISDFMETRHLFTDHHGLEESFRASESLGSNCDDLTIRKFVSLVILSWTVIGYIMSEFTINFCFEVKSNITEFFFDISDCLWFSWWAEV